MELNEKLIKNFGYTFKLPIPVFKPEYFDHFRKVLDPYYDISKKMEIFLKAFDDENSISENGTVKIIAHRRMIKDIENSPDFLKFSQSKSIVEFFEKNKYIEHKNIYHIDNDQKYFITVDLVKANFQSFIHNNFDVFGGAKTFEDFAKNYNVSEILMESKILRQVVFGSLNPKKQQMFQKKMMIEIQDLIVNSGLFEEKLTIYSMSTDEIYFEAKKEDLDKIKKLEDYINSSGFQVRVEHFKLHSPFIKTGFYKEFADGSKNINLVPKDKLCQFIKLIEGKELTDLDFLFTGQDGELCKHMEVFYLPK